MLSETPLVGEENPTTGNFMSPIIDYMNISFKNRHRDATGKQVEMKRAPSFLPGISRFHFVCRVKKYRGQCASWWHSRWAVFWRCALADRGLVDPCQNKLSAERTANRSVGWFVGWMVGWRECGFKSFCINLRHQSFRPSTNISISIVHENLQRRPPWVLKKRYCFLK